MHPPSHYLLQVPKINRWLIYARLQQLSVACTCTQDGRLLVEVETPIHLLQIYSVVRQLTDSRQELVNRLERCWNLNLSSHQQGHRNHDEV